MRLTVVGCSPAWPNPGAAHSGYLVEHGGARVLLDCGPGVLPRLRAAEGWPKVDAIVISHFHLDHSGDLVPWLWGHLMGPAAGTRGPALWLPPESRADLDALASGFDEAFDVREYAERSRFSVGALSITPLRVPHYDRPTWALRVEAGGRVLAYSADTSPSPALVDCARGADLFLCEATLDGPDREPRGHLRADEAAAAAEEAGAQRLLLVHRPVELPPPHGLEAATDGLVVEL
ncbi:MAG TPA: MBL fold metallo-hydrolase [Gaiellaceae bacterium]|nr:MBL fold metallo-hydrolase [Gaiellaceae bacterium]